MSNPDSRPSFDQTVQRNLGFLLLTQGALAVVTALILTRFSAHSVIPFLAGSAFMALNFLLLGLFWKRVFDKKPVAMTLVLVITKYSSLGVILFLLVNKWSHQLAPLIAGTTTLLGSFLILALRLSILEMKNKNAF